MSRSLAIAYQMKRKGKNCASGGTVESGDETMNYAEGGSVDPMLEVTCPKCQNKFSHGGQVANDVGQGEVADEKPNEFDDLVLRDELEEHYTGDNSGDKIGGPSKDDAVARAMLKRKGKK